MSSVVATDLDFDTEVLQSSIPVLVDFWAEWCPPCKVIEPVLDALASQYAGRLKLVKVNADESPEVSSRYGIVSLPTILLFKSGEVANVHVGAAPARVLEGIFKEYL